MEKMALSIAEQKGHLASSGLIPRERKVEGLESNYPNNFESRYMIQS